MSIYQINSTHLKKQLINFNMKTSKTWLLFFFFFFPFHLPRGKRELNEKQFLCSKVRSPWHKAAQTNKSSSADNPPWQYIYTGFWAIEVWKGFGHWLCGCKLTYPKEREVSAPWLAHEAGGGQHHTLLPWGWANSLGRWESWKDPAYITICYIYSNLDITFGIYMLSVTDTKICFR